MAKGNEVVGGGKRSPLKNARSHSRNIDRKARRAAKADQMLTAWRKMSPAEQWEALDERLGKGKGAQRQRMRIKSAMTIAKAA